ncbi:MAG TPA: DUF1972 domain-containing protein [Chloroflexota bacterium]|nr:DUF1972 domain-containing protein [Chloroflexota bacterium]
MPVKPRIAIIGARGVPARWGGFETVATELSTRLVERGFDVTVYCRPRYSLPDRPSSFRGVRLVYLPAIDRKSWESLSHELLSLAHALTQRYDAVYVLGFRGSFLYAPAIALGQRIFFNTDGLDWKRRKWGRLGRTYLKWAERVGVRLAPKNLIADSQAIAAYFEDAYGVIPTYLTYGANIVRPSNPDIVRGYGLEPRDYFVVVCRIEPENNVDVIVEAFARVKTDKKLAIVGGANYDSPYLAGLRAAARPNTLFLGPVYTPGHIEELYGQSYAYIHGHEVGGTNPALLHAMGTGACVLSNDVAYNREVLGAAGLYWQRSPDLLRQRMEEILADPEQADHFRHLAVARVREHFNWDRIADQYAEYFASRLPVGPTVAPRPAEPTIAPGEGRAA